MMEKCKNNNNLIFNEFFEVDRSIDVNNTYQASL